MTYVFAHRTAAFATHILPIRDAVANAPRCAFPDDAISGPSVQYATRLSSRLGINERLCLDFPNKSARKRGVAYIARVAQVTGEELFIPLGSGLYVPVPELCFVQMASELSLPELIRFGFDLCGTYAPGHGSIKTIYQLSPLSTRQSLIEFCESHPYLDYAKKARGALNYVLDNSASPQESNLSIFFTLPFKYGGYAAPFPVLNVLYDKAREDRFPDLYWPEYGIDMEFNGAEFHKEVTDDAVRRNQLQPNLRVFTVTGEMFRDLGLMDGLALDFYAAAGKRFRPRTKDYDDKRKVLHKTLCSPEWYRRAAPSPYAFGEPKLDEEV